MLLFAFPNFNDITVLTVIATGLVIAFYDTKNLLKHIKHRAETLAKQEDELDEATILIIEDAAFWE